PQRMRLPGYSWNRGLSFWRGRSSWPTGSHQGAAPVNARQRYVTAGALWPTVGYRRVARARRAERGGCGAGGDGHKETGGRKDLEEVSQLRTIRNNSQLTKK